MSADSQVEVIQKPEETVLMIGTLLNEDTVLPGLIQHPRLIVDFQNLKHVNSFGIKKWCQWMKQHNTVRTIILDHCPYIFSRSFPIVVGMVGGNTRVRSLYVPYFSEKTNERKDILYKHGEHFDDKGPKSVTPPVDRDGKPMVLDVEEDQYFRFVKK